MSTPKKKEDLSKTVIAAFIVCLIPGIGQIFFLFLMAYFGWYLYSTYREETLVKKYAEEYEFLRQEFINKWMNFKEDIKTATSRVEFDAITKEYQRLYSNAHNAEKATLPGIHDANEWIEGLILQSGKKLGKKEDSVIQEMVATMPIPTDEKERGSLLWALKEIVLLPSRIITAVMQFIYKIPANTWVWCFGTPRKKELCIVPEIPSPTCIDVAPAADLADTIIAREIQRWQKSLSVIKTAAISNAQKFQQELRGRDDRLVLASVHQWAEEQRIMRQL
jgi:hypothetical protein